jgi:hypothetical protein
MSPCIRSGGLSLTGIGTTPGIGRLSHKPPARIHESYSPVISPDTLAVESRFAMPEMRLV